MTAAQRLCPWPWRLPVSGALEERVERALQAIGILGALFALWPARDPRRRKAAVKEEEPA